MLIALAGCQKTRLQAAQKDLRGEAREKSTSGGVRGEYVVARRLSATKHMSLFQQPASTTVSLTPIHHVAAGASREFPDDRPRQSIAQRGDGVGHVTLRALGSREVCNLGVGKPFLIERSFF